MGEYVNLLSGARLVTETCCRCKTIFAMSRALYDAASERKEDMPFYCPNGHRQWYVTGATEAEKLRLERDRLKQQLACAEDQRQAAEAAALKADRALKRHKKRAAAGTCPCCKRTFSALAEHIKRQHPEFITEQGGTVVPIKARA